MPYPTRGAWSFYNVTRSQTFWPTLDSISITQEHPDLVAAFSCSVVDPTNSVAFEVEDEVRVTFAGERVWAGHLKTVTEDQVSEVGPRVWKLDGQDYTAKLEDALVRRRRKRKREKAKRRVKWLLNQLERHVWDLAGRDLSHIPDEYVGAYDYFGQSVNEALSQIADELRCHYYIDLDNVFQMYRSDTVAAPFDLDNEAPNFTTTFPFRQWNYAEDSVDLANAILVQPEKRKHSRWVKDASSIATYGRQERFVSDSNIHRAKQARAIGNRALNAAKDPQEESSGIVVHEPGLQAGMTVHVREALWDHDFDRFIKAVEIGALDPHDDNGEAYLVTTLTLGEANRRRKRKGHGQAIDKIERKRHGQVANVNTYDLDAFARVVAPPSWTTGSSVGTLASYQASKGEDVDGNDIAFAISSAAIYQASSYIGAGYKGWTTEDCGCPGLENCFKGWKDIERWFYLTVPTHPANAAGILVTFPAGTGNGVGTAGARIVVRSAQPTDTWQGTVVGYANASASTTVFIPIALVPAAGDVIHIGMQANWRCSYGSTACGWQWPFTTGDGNSGRFLCTPDLTPDWAIFSDAGGSMGALATPSGAPWEGGNDWNDGGVEGSPTYGVDGTAYYVDGGTSLSGRGIYVKGEREDDDQPWGPWSDGSWAVEFTFSVDAVGDTGTAGPRSIAVTTECEGENIVGTVHLGDSTNAPGISVTAGGATVYSAVSLTDTDKWRARFDTRSGKLRGKLWLVSDGEPASWNVETPMSETEDDADRFSLWVRCGQAGGQEVRIYRLRAAQDANDGRKVDREFLGHANGVQTRFYTNHPFREGTLRVFVNGAGVAPLVEYGDDAEFTLDFRPTTRSIIRASYVVDQGEGDE